MLARVHVLVLASVEGSPVAESNWGLSMHLSLWTKAWNMGSLESRALGIFKNKLFKTSKIMYGTIQDVQGNAQDTGGLFAGTGCSSSDAGGGRRLRVVWRPT